MLGECSPDVAMAGNGDTITIQGSGSLGIFPKSVSGGGTFVHKNSGGTVLGSGTWVATQLLNFKSYGGFSISIDSTSLFLEGGLAHIRVHVTALSGVEFDAILTVDCQVGSPPPSGDEGISFLVQPTGLNFNSQVSGDTLFIPS